MANFAYREIDMWVMTRVRPGSSKININIFFHPPPCLRLPVISYYAVKPS